MLIRDTGMQIRHITVSRSDSGRPLRSVLRSRLRLGAGALHQLFADKRIRVSGKPCPDGNRIVRQGDRIDVLPHQASADRKRRRTPTIQYSDSSVAVVNKPAGLTTMRHPQEAAEFGQRAQRFLPPTLVDVVASELGVGKHQLRPVHRIDKETSGLVVLARTPAAAHSLGQRFREHTIERLYLALVRGKRESGTIESFLTEDRGDGRRGSTADPATGKRAVTHLRKVEDLGDFTLLECRLETGRTHQVRIHLGETGTPLVGEHVYDRPLHGGPVNRDTTGFPRPALHAATLGFQHPLTGKWMRFQAEPPADFKALLRRLRRAVQASRKKHSANHDD